MNKTKTVKESIVADYPHTIFPNDLNAVKTAFGGRVLEIADRVAAIAAQRHSGKTCVTLGVDSVRFLAPAQKGETLIFKAAVNRVWKSSMEVGVKVLVENFQTGENRHVVSAYFTFVAINDRKRPIKVTEIIPETPEEKRRYQEADQRRQLRLQQEKKQTRCLKRVF
ncbi:MAG: acyl-CoA thioesterase [Patescibacteria group bacterium]